MERSNKIGDALNADVFDKIHRMSLLPIIQLSTKPVHDKFGYVILQEDSLNVWAEFVGKKIKIGLKGNIAHEGKIIAIMPKTIASLTLEDANKCGFADDKEFKEFLCARFENKSSDSYNTKIYLLIIKI